MKIKMPKEYRRMFTLDNLKAAKGLIQAMKEDESTPAEYLIIAARDIIRNESDYVDIVLTAEAEVAFNCRVWNVYGEESGTMDIWITGIVKCYDQILEIGSYLTDIWNVNGENTAVIDHSFVVRYKRQ